MTVEPSKRTKRREAINPEYFEVLTAYERHGTPMPKIISNTLPGAVELRYTSGRVDHVNLYAGLAIMLSAWYREDLILASR